MAGKNFVTRLYEIAREQQGYFTRNQAISAGYSPSHFAHHLQKEHWAQEGRGIYKLVRYPPGERPDLVFWTLWSCNRSGEPQGVFSHETALSIHELSDVMPSNYHMTVPKGFRRSKPLPTNLVIYRATVKPTELWQMDGYHVTNPYRTVLDVIADDSIPYELVVQAIREAWERGLISRRMLNELASSANGERAMTIMKMVSDLC